MCGEIDLHRNEDRLRKAFEFPLCRSDSLPYGETEVKHYLRFCTSFVKVQEISRLRLRESQERRANLQLRTTYRNNPSIQQAVENQANRLYLLRLFASSCRIF